MLPHGPPFPPPPAVGSRLVLIAIQTLGDRISFYLKDEFTGLVWIVEPAGPEPGRQRAEAESL